MTTANLDNFNLTAVAFGGLVSEDVMEQVWNISKKPLAFTDRVGSDSSEANYTEWTQDQQAAVDVDNATVDGAAATGNDAATGERVGNLHQYPDKVVRVSTRARNVKTIGFQDTYAYQVMMRQRDLRQDVEGISLQPQASVVDDGDSVAGRLGGFPSWLETNTSRGVGGADGGFDGAGIVDAPTAGDGRAGTETLIRDMAEAAWVQGGNPSILMSLPATIRGLSTYMFTSSARIATLQKQAEGVAAAKAIGSVNVFLTDFDVVLEMVPNRYQQTYLSGDTIPIAVANVFLIDPEYVMLSYLQGYRVDELGKAGTSTEGQMTVDVTVKVLDEAAHAVIADVDPTLAWTL